MLRKEVTGKTAALALLIILAGVQLVYWRLLVYRPPGPPMQGGGGGPAPAGGPPVFSGRDDAVVETLAGNEPGFVDGPGWQARLCGPNAIAATPEGNLVVADSRNHAIRQVTPQGVVSTLFGSPDREGPDTLRYPSGVAAAADGSLFISDTGHHRICRLREGRLEVVAGGDSPGRADGTGTAARFHSPTTLTVGPGGALWVADAGNRTVRRVELSGAVTTPAQAPAVVKAILGDVGPAVPAPAVSASVEGRGMPLATEAKAGRLAAGATRGPVRVTPDPTYHVLLAQAPDLPLFILAGRRMPTEGVLGDDDDTGARAGFAVPCAVALGPDGTAYVAEYEGNRIRRVRLPEWLVSAGAPPPDRGRFRGRSSRGS